MSAESAVIKYGFQDHKEFFDSKADSNKCVATCKFCQKKNNRKTETTSSFTRHLKLVHPAKYKKYFESSRSAGNENQRITLWLLCPEEYRSYLCDFVKKESSSEIGCAECIRIPRTK